MVDCCFTQELEEVANRLLPPDIFAEIGTVTAAGTCCCCSHAVIEELALHLNNILGLADMKAEHQPPQANTTVQSNHWSNGGDGMRSDRVLRTNGEMAKLVPGFCENDIALHSSTMTMTFAAPLRAGGEYQPMAVRQYNEHGADEFRLMRRQNGSGTGVFFPRAAALCHTRSSNSLGNNGKCG
jgi:hypothetical protein